MASRTISQLDITENVIGSEYLLIDDTERTTRTTINTVTDALSTAIVQSIQSTTIVAVNSAWDSTYTTVHANSANWSLSGNPDIDTIITSNSANWSNTYTTVHANSANWSLSSAALSSNPNYDSVYTTVQSNSANWLSVITPIIQISAASYTISLSDTGKYIRKEYYSAHSITIPFDNGVFLPGTTATIRNAGLSALTIVPASSSVILNYDSNYDSNIIDPKNTAQVIYIGNNNWDIV